MILILIAICTAALVSALLLTYSADHLDGARGFLSSIFGVTLAVGAGLAAVSYAFAGWSWIAAESKAQIINCEYGTKYTQEEIFYASDVIDTIREIDRKRIEVNGNVLRDDKEKANDR